MQVLGVFFSYYHFNVSDDFLLYVLRPRHFLSRCSSCRAATSCRPAGRICFVGKDNLSLKNKISEVKEFPMSRVYDACEA